jgi:dTDP-4-amino-4,6-dideoxygalactose transaminase
LNIPFLDVKATWSELEREIRDALDRTLQSGWYVLGEQVSAFENEFAAYCESRHCIGVASGLDALLLILKGYDIGDGDEVIVPAHTFIATWLAVSHSGAIPVPVEPLADSCNIDPDGIEAKISGKTRAIIAVHLYGQPADMEAIRRIADRYDLKVIEDAAQAHGARYRGRRTGSLGDAAAFSFYPGKNLGAFGDGGAVTTDDDDLNDRLRYLRNYGSVKKYHHEFRGGPAG